MDLVKLNAFTEELQKLNGYRARKVRHLKRKKERISERIERKVKGETKQYIKTVGPTHKEKKQLRNAQNTTS